MRRETVVTIAATAMGLAIAASGLAARRRMVPPVIVEEETELPPQQIITAVSEVQREPGLIPFVQGVEVLESGADYVRYMVNGLAFGIPWWMEFRKRWNLRASTVEWVSERGAYGMSNWGHMVVRPAEGRNIIRLETGLRVPFPWIGPALERIGRPLLAYAMGVWLKKLAAGTEVPAVPVRLLGMRIVRRGTP